MLILSNELLKMFSKYLKGDVSINSFRDYMAGLRVDRYNVLASADRLFLNEFEGRFAEFVDFGGDEALLKASLASFVQAENSSTSVYALVWSFPLQQPDESKSSYSVGTESSPTQNSSAAVACA